MPAYGIMGEITLLPFDWEPRNWARCDGRLVAINDNQALFSLLGITYGGNGVTTFALPDLRGRVPVGLGQSGPPFLGDTATEREVASGSDAEVPGTLRMHWFICTDGMYPSRP